MEKKYSRTNLFIIDDELWQWAKFRASTLGFNSVSEYLFKFIQIDQNAPWNLSEKLRTPIGGKIKFVHLVGDKEAKKNG